MIKLEVIEMGENNKALDDETKTQITVHWMERHQVLAILEGPCGEKKGLAGEVVCDRRLSIFWSLCEESCCMQKVKGREEGSERDRHKNEASSWRRWEEFKNIDGTSKILVKPEELGN